LNFEFFEPPRREEREGSFLLPFPDRNPDEISAKKDFIPVKQASRLTGQVGQVGQAAQAG